MASPGAMVTHVSEEKRRVPLPTIREIFSVRDRFRTTAGAPFGGGGINRIRGSGGASPPVYLFSLGIITNKMNQNHLDL